MMAEETKYTKNEVRNAIEKAISNPVKRKEGIILGQWVIDLPSLRSNILNNLEKDGKRK